MTIKQIEEQLEEGFSLKAVAQAYSEIANLKIKKIRNAVLRNRLFFEEIAGVYGAVKTYGIKRKVSAGKTKNRLCILLTSNYRFYGSINSSLINYFIGSTRELDVDRIILGKGAIEYFRATGILKNYQEIILKSDMPDPEELANLIKIAGDYNQVLVFHSKFKSLLLQRATFTDITATSFYLKFIQSNPLIKKSEAGQDFIFEPELPEIIRFFDSQILTLLLEQTFLESELSRTASRFISMDQAETKADDFIKDTQKLRSYAKRSVENIKILENFASIMAERKYESG